MQLAELTVRGFADLLGSDAPAPGGGSAAALAGTLGAALTAMVGSLTVGRKKYTEFDGLARETLEGKILGGIIPVVSQRNALFMNSEVAGITVDPQIVALYEGKDRAQGEELAVKISTEIAKAIAPYVDGFYLMTPFGRTGLMARIMASIRENHLTE